MKPVMATEQPMSFAPFGGSVRIRTYWQSWWTFSLALSILAVDNMSCNAVDDSVARVGLDFLLDPLHLEAAEQGGQLIDPLRAGLQAGASL